MVMVTGGTPSTSLQRQRLRGAGSGRSPLGVARWCMHPRMASMTMQRLALDVVEAQCQGMSFVA
jgi:hypothetical protein